MMRWTGFVVGLGAILVTGACGAAPEMAMQGTPEDELILRGVADQYVAAFNAGDAAALAAMVSDDYMVVVPDGSTISGKAGVEQMEAEGIQMRQKMNLNMTLHATTSFVQWLNAETATIGGTWTADGLPEGQPNRGSWLAVAHKTREGEWLLTSTLAADYIEPPPVDAAAAPAA
jgi:ketosteroid isomerase-like protein